MPKLTYAPTEAVLITLKTRNVNNDTVTDLLRAPYTKHDASK
jgi:hypothetical protein